MDYRGVIPVRECQLLDVMIVDIMGVGWMEILVILVVALIALGPDKLPDMARNVGKSLRDVQQAMRDTTRVLTEEEPEDVRKTREAIAAQRRSAQPADAKPAEGKALPPGPEQAQAQQQAFSDQSEPKSPQSPR